MLYTVETVVEIAVEPGIVTVLGGAQVPVTFWVYHIVLGLAVHHMVEGTQLLIQKVDEPEVYGLMGLWVVPQTEIVLVKTAGVVGISSHSPHSQHGSVLVMTVGGGVGVMSSHSPHSQHGSVVVTTSGGGMDIASHSGHGSAITTTLGIRIKDTQSRTVKKDIIVNERDKFGETL